MKKDTNVKTSETLASYYVRRYGHLLNDIEVWEIDDNDMKVVRGESIVV